jgi:hypothetical protein
LEFIETKARDPNGDDRLVRVSYEKSGASQEARVPHRDRSFVERPIEALSAEYQVVAKRLDVPESLAKRTHGQRIDVNRVSDGKTIAYAEYYWDNNKWWECPDGISKGDFIADFLSRSLGLPKP